MSFEQERNTMLSELQGEILMPTIVGIADLGAGNTGKISAAELTQDQKNGIVNELASPEYHLLASNTFICVDMRTAEEGDALLPEETEADPQIAGSLPVTETASDMMVTPKQKMKVSELSAKNTRDCIAAGFKVKVHGDSHAKKAGCGACRLLCDRSVLRQNAEHADIVAPLVWGAAKMLELDTWVKEDDISEFIINGKENADNDELWDVTPEENIDIMIANGADYEELAGEHHEMAAALKTRKGAFAKRRFMIAHPRVEGGNNSAFGVALAEYRDAVFEKTQMLGGTELEAAKRVVAGLLFNVGALKALTAEETGKGEALPVVVIA